MFLRQLRVASPVQSRLQNEERYHRAADAAWVNHGGLHVTSNAAPITKTFPKGK
jgi:hypothetical protein